MPKYSVTLRLEVSAENEARAEAEFYKLVSSGEYDSDTLEIEDITRAEKEMSHEVSKTVGVSDAE